MREVEIWNYGNYSGHYGTNSMGFTVGSLRVYFSYKTPVAFNHPSTGLVVRDNNWGPTTGKHLNWIDGGDKKNRVAGSEFEKQLAKLVEGTGIKIEMA